MDVLLSQAPEGVDIEKCQELLEKYKGNCANVLAELWNIEEKRSVISDEKTKWTEIRDLCNEYDEELNKFLQEKKI